MSRTGSACGMARGAGALAGLSMRDFDKRTRSLTIGWDKKGNPRQISLPQVIADFFGEQVKGKLPAAPIFARAGDEAWNKDAWKYPIKEAVKAAGLPRASSAYTLRHSVYGSDSRSLADPDSRATFRHKCCYDRKTQWPSRAR